MFRDNFQWTTPTQTTSPHTTPPALNLIRTLFMKDFSEAVVQKGFLPVQNYHEEV